MWFFLCPLQKHFGGKGFLCFVHCCNPESDMLQILQHLLKTWTHGCGGRNWRRIQWAYFSRVLKNEQRSQHVDGVLQVRPPPTGFLGPGTGLSTSFSLGKILEVLSPGHFSAPSQNRGFFSFTHLAMLGLHGRLGDNRVCLPFSVALVLGSTEESDAGFPAISVSPPPPAKSASLGSSLASLLVPPFSWAPGEIHGEGLASASQLPPPTPPPRVCPLSRVRGPRAAVLSCWLTLGLWQWIKTSRRAILIIS